MSITCYVTVVGMWNAVNVLRPKTPFRSLEAKPVPNSLKTICNFLHPSIHFHSVGEMSPRWKWTFTRPFRLFKMAASRINRHGDTKSNQFFMCKSKWWIPTGWRDKSDDNSAIYWWIPAQWSRNESLTSAQVDDSATGGGETDEWQTFGSHLIGNDSLFTLTFTRIILLLWMRLPTDPQIPPQKKKYLYRYKKWKKKLEKKWGTKPSSIPFYPFPKIVVRMNIVHQC